MTDDNDPQMMGGTPPGAPKKAIAEGPKEFKADPSEFMNILNGMGMNTDPNETRALAGIEPSRQKTFEGQNNDSDKAAMKDILSRLNDSAEYAVEKSYRDPQTKTDVTKAVLNEEYADKEWKINVTESTSGKTLYNVVNVNAKKSFFRDLYLKETARKLCQLLENNVPLNSQKVTSVLYYDEVYRKNYDEAMSYKKIYGKAKREGNRSRASIYESKFEHARENAIAAKKTLKKI